MTWPTFKMGDVFDIARGGSPRPIHEYISDAPDAVNWISIKDASDSNKYIRSTKLRIRREGISRSRMVHPGDFLLTNSMSYGRPYIMATSGCIHDGWLVLSGRNGLVDQDFMYHLLGADLVTSQFSKLAKGAVVQNLNIDLVKSVEIPLPPISEQKRIAAILDKANEIRRKRAETSCLSEKLLKSAFLDMFGDPVSNPKGWEVANLGDLAHRVTKGESPGWQGFRYEDAGVRFVTSENVLWGTLDIGKGKYISDAFDRKLRRSALREDDVLVNLVGASIGRVALVSRDALPANVNQAVAVVTLEQCKMLPAFLLHQLLTHTVQRRLLGSAVEVARANISLTDIRELKCIVPSIEMQTAWARVTAGVARKQQSLGRTSVLHEQLYDSLVQRVFTGNL